jgi:hypothetical protein
MKIKYYQTLLFLFVVVISQAQDRSDSIAYSLNSRVNTGTGNYSPFLSTANQYDRFSLSPNALTLWGTIHKKPEEKKRFDYGFGIELDANYSGDEKRFFPNELYIQGKFGFLNVYAGNKQQVYGNQDADLSSGGLLWSQNSRPIPKIAIESNDYIPIPFTKGYVEVKGGLSHGCFYNDGGIHNLLLHHKYAYMRLGGTFPLNIHYGIQHVVQWGGQSSQYGTMPVTWDNYFRILMGKSGNSTANISDQINTLGNHIISQNVGLDLKTKSILIALYWQNISEDLPVKLMTKSPNIEDGLWGMSVKLPTFKPFSHFVVEYLSTTDQNGPWHDLDGIIYGGQDSYYTNGLIPNGWSYRGMTIANPWITSPKYNENGSSYTNNNTVRLYYFSGKGTIKSINYRITLAYSKNYGLTRPIYEDYKKQFSWQFEVSSPKSFIKDTSINLGFSGDQGKMYGNNLGVWLGLSYTGFWKY